nr:nonstructural protein [Flumine parvovirus 17]
MPQLSTSSYHAMTAKVNGVPDRWFHMTWPVQRDADFDAMMSHVTELGSHENIRYLLVTQHDESCTLKLLTNSITKHAHYHAIIWLIQPRNSTQIIKLFKLFDYKVNGKPHYYCKPKYSTSTMSGFINYVAKYKTVCEYGTLPARVIAERQNPGKKDLPTDSEKRMSTAINWVRKGQDETYRNMDPVHYTRNYAKIKSLWGNQQQFTKDKREFVNYWIHGPPGTGKSAILAALWPGAYALRDQYWDGFNPRSDNHRVVTLKDINSRWILDYGITALKVLCDKDGHNINIKYAGGEVVNHGRVIVTSNHSIYDCVAGTSKDEIVGLDKEVQAIKRRFMEISIADFLDLAGLTLKPKHLLDEMKGKQIENYMDLFTMTGPNGILGYGDEKSPYTESQSSDEDI